MHGTVDVDRNRAHDHVVGFYRRDDELISTIAPFLAEALDDQGTAIVIATGAHRNALDAALVLAGLPIEQLRASGRYRSLDAEETLAGFMRDDMPDPDAFASVVGGILDEVGGSGGPVHAFGEMVALLWDAGNVAAAIELESLWNDLAAHHSFALYCAYSMSSLETSDDLAAAKEVCDRHSDVRPLHAAQHDWSHIEEGASECDDVSRLFVPAPVVIADTRSFARHVLRTWGYDQLAADAEVIVSELVTNAMLHARSPFRVSIARTNSSITISVRDACPDPPTRVTGSVLRKGGRGIALVAALSHTWGSREEADGKTVFAKIPRQPSR